jgi:hypothetical protein
MRFIESDEIREWFGDHAINLAANDTFEIPGTSLVISGPFGQAAEPQGNEKALAMSCVECVGTWDACLLWIQEWGVWPSSEDWPAYYEARGQQGERRSLGVAPGHLFEAGEKQLAIRFLQLVLENAWEAQLVSASHGKPVSRVYISHDEWVEIWAPGELSPSVRAG